jgi:ElaB/YqjD/DUF883 family membrane-anchored ribosome-binding protein
VELKDAITGGAEEVWSSVRDAGYDVRERAAMEFAAARDRAGEYVDEGRAKLQGLGHSAENYIRHQPLTSLMIAVGAGFLLGALWTRR